MKHVAFQISSVSFPKRFQISTVDWCSKQIPPCGLLRSHRSPPIQLRRNAIYRLKVLYALPMPGLLPGAKGFSGDHWYPMQAWLPYGSSVVDNGPETRFDIVIVANVLVLFLAPNKFSFSILLNFLFQQIKRKWWDLEEKTWNNPLKYKDVRFCSHTSSSQNAPLRHPTSTPTGRVKGLIRSMNQSEPNNLHLLQRREDYGCSYSWYPSKLSPVRTVGMRTCTEMQNKIGMLAKTFCFKIWQLWEKSRQS